MAVDTTAAITVDRHRDDVASYLWDPANDREWIGGLRSARLVTPAPVAVGSRVQRVASFLGRRVEYLNEITELTPDRLVMRSVRAPFPMRITYELHDAGGGATEVAVRVEGELDHRHTHVVRDGNFRRFLHITVHLNPDRRPLLVDRRWWRRRRRGWRRRGGDGGGRR